MEKPKFEKSLLNLLIVILENSNQKTRKKFKWQILLMVLASFTEILSIGAVLPFMSVLLAPNGSSQKFIPGFILEFLREHDINSIYFFFSFFCISVVLCSLIRIILIYSNTNFCFKFGAELSSEIYRKILFQEYLEHVYMGVSIPIDIITTKTNGLIHNCILSCLNLISSFVLISIVSLSLVFLNPVLLISLFLFMGSIYLLIIIYTRNILSKNSIAIANLSGRIIKILHESLGGIREVILNRNHSYFHKRYSDLDFQLRKSQGFNLVIGQLPRYIVEAVGMLIIAIICMILVNVMYMPLDQALPMLAAITLGAQRLMPLIQNAFLSWSNLQGSKGSLADIIECIEKPIPNLLSNVDNLHFNKTLALDRISFHYSNNSNVFQDISLQVSKGEKVGIVGVTGGGKSTLIDIISGLIKPIDGSVIVDGVAIDSQSSQSWWRLVSYVSQDAFLFDVTIAENIAFGIAPEEVDFFRVQEVSKVAQIYDEIVSMPMGFMTLAGERGVQLSGGQRQRIAIARALYKEPKLLILDEATSALDHETERNIMDQLSYLHPDVTIIMVTHKSSTLKLCTTVYELKDKKLIPA